MIDPDTGAGVAATWAILEQSFRTDLLSVAWPSVASTSHPDENLILSYWHDLLHETPEQPRT